MLFETTIQADEHQQSISQRTETLVSDGAAYGQELTRNSGSGFNRYPRIFRTLVQNIGLTQPHLASNKGLKAFAVFLVLLMGGGASYGLENESQLNLPVYPGSQKLNQTSEEDISTHELILGSLKKINNQLAPERSERVQGRLSSVTYNIPAGRSSKEVYQYYLEQVVQRGQVLFTCVARDCGSSSFWANTVFGQSKLYGPEQYQHLIVAGFTHENRSTFVSIYTLQRGNRSVLAYVQSIAREQEITLGRLQESIQLLRKGKAVGLRDLVFEADGSLILDSRRISSHVELLEALDFDRVLVVAHASLRYGLERSEVIARENAESLIKHLVEAGIEQGRLIPKSVGGLSPVPGRDDNRIELILLK